MISKNRIKFIHSLEQKKVRKQEGVFVAEGHKLVGDLLHSGFLPIYIAHTDVWTKSESFSIIQNKGIQMDLVSQKELKKASFLQHPQQVLGIFQMPNSSSLPNEAELNNNIYIALDGIQDPGNLGTIIRIADWFGISTIICSNETVDAFSPKVVQATMGSIARVNILYTDLNDFLNNLHNTIPVYGTLLEGDDIYMQNLSENGIIIMGNEGNGISEKIRNKVNRKLFIPSYPPNKPTAESLNVSIATAITLAEFRRPKIH